MGAELFGPADVPRMVAVGDLRGVDLTAEEGFLLSRIDGRVSVGGLLSLVSWDREKTMALLESLLKKHLVNFDRKEISEAAFAGSAQTKPASPTPSATNGAAPAPKKPAAGTIDPSTVERVPDLELDRCVEVLEWEKSVLTAPTLYAMFRLPDGADPRSVKRQYRAMAMSFHPDKFFRKEIGSYRLKIEVAWKKVQEAYELLQDDAKRDRYQAEVAARPKQRPVDTAPAKPFGKQIEEPGPGRAPAGIAAMVLAPLDDFERPKSRDIPLVQGQRVEPKPQMESALARKIKAEVKERNEKALRQFTQAKQDFNDGKYGLADSNVKLAMQFDPRNEEYKAWYEKALPKIEEGMVGIILKKAALAESSNETKSAQESFQHAMSLFPENLDANLALGVFLMKRSENPKIAKDCLQKVVAKRPRSLEALVGLARALRLLGMLKNAARILEQAKEVGPKDPRVLEEVKELKRAK